MLTCAAAAKSVVSDSERPHRRQPTRLPHRWDSPGKNTGVGCHFLLQCMKVKSESEVAQSCPTVSNPVDCLPPGSSIHGIFQARVLEGVPLPSPHIVYSTLNKHSFKHHLSAQCVLVGMEDPKLSLSFQCLVRKSTSSGSRQNSSNPSPGKTNETKFISIENLRGEM